MLCYSLEIEPLHSQNHQICGPYFSTVVQLQSIIMTPSCCSHRLFRFCSWCLNALWTLCDRFVKGCERFHVQLRKTNSAHWSFAWCHGCRRFLRNGQSSVVDPAHSRKQSLGGTGLGRDTSVVALWWGHDVLEPAATTTPAACFWCLAAWIRPRPSRLLSGASGENIGSAKVSGALFGIENHRLASRATRGAFSRAQKPMFYVWPREFQQGGWWESAECSHLLQTTYGWQPRFVARLSFSMALHLRWFKLATRHNLTIGIQTMAPKWMLGGSPQLVGYKLWTELIHTNPTYIHRPTSTYIYLHLLTFTVNWGRLVITCFNPLTGTKQWL